MLPCKFDPSYLVETIFSPILTCHSLVIQCLIIYFFFVETRGPTLEEIAMLFDGEDSAAGIAKAQANTKMEHEHVDRKRSV